MQGSVFFRLGSWVYRWRWMMVCLAMLMLALSIPIMPHIMKPFKSTGFMDDKAPSATVLQFLDKKLGYHHDNQFMVLYHSRSLKTTDPVFLNQIKQSLSGLHDFSIQHDVIFPNQHNRQLSDDEHTAVAVVIVRSPHPLTDSQLSRFQSLIKKPPHMTMHLGGEAFFTESVNQQTQQDLYKADAITLPFSIVVLLLVFGSVVAALVPLSLGGSCALFILASLYALGHWMMLSVFTVNIALLLGLCLGLDYALFIINRFRYELSQTSNDVCYAISMTLATAGRAVFFSGLAVFISLSALLFFPINILFSIGVGGLTAAFMAVMIALFVLPALLSILGMRINAGSVYGWKRHTSSQKEGRMWRALAERVVGYPFLFFSVSLIVLLCLGAPFLKAQLGLSDYHILPKQAEGRKFFDQYGASFHEQDLTPIMLVLSVDKGRILAPHAIAKLYDLSEKLQHNKHVLEVDSLVTTTPRLSKAEYMSYYRSIDPLSPVMQVLFNASTHDHFTVIRVVSKGNANSAETRALIRTLRHLDPGPGFHLELTGTPVINMDVHDTIEHLFPYVVLWIMVLTYVILLVVLRSLLLPLKAIFMNILSLSACYGVLVFIFQEGHFHQWLHFDPQGFLDVSLLVIVFCAIFGFSMDYEVFLLTRIQEAYRKTHDNQSSIIFGIEQSSRIITSAALIVICICASFMVADVLMVKEFGLGIAVAIFVDAFIIRSVLVPSTMALLKGWNWYFPQWLERLLRHPMR